MKSFFKSNFGILVLSYFLFQFATNPLIALASGNPSQASTDLFNQDQAAEIKDVEGLRAEFKQYTQSPDSKEVKFEMILKSTIDSDRVKITWSLSGASLFAPGQLETRNIKVAAGQSYSIPITIIPAGYGITELFGKAEAFKPDSTYLVTVRKNFASNQSSEILPLTDDYNNSKTLSLVRTILIVIVILAGVLLGGFFGVKRFSKWLNKNEKPDVKIPSNQELPPPVAGSATPPQPVNNSGL
jgi:hypothetical protein